MAGFANFCSFPHRVWERAKATWLPSRNDSSGCPILPLFQVRWQDIDRIRVGESRDVCYDYDSWFGVLEMAKTAIQVTAEDMALYRATARRQAKQERQAQLQRAERARGAAYESARLLKEKFGARRVILFGSLARSDYFHLRSDIDLAVEGVSPQNFWRAWAALDTVAPEFEFDLIDIETAPAALRQQIEQEGVEI